MKTFGELLKDFRRQCTDPIFSGTLTQERLGELIGDELGNDGYSGGAISEWERNQSKPKQNNFPVLIALIRVMVKYGGIRTHTDADNLLISGNYRPLSEFEKIAIFGTTDSSDQPNAESGTRWPVILSPFKELHFQLKNEWQYLASKLEEPTPNIFSVIWDWLGHFQKRFPGEMALKAVGWLAVGLLVWAFTFPLLKWPLGDETQAILVTYAYIAGSITIPLIIGGLSRTTNNNYWKQRKLEQSRDLRLYTYQGAFIGFHLSFTLIFIVRLFLHYLNFSGFSFWTEGLATIFIILVSYSAARQVPFNLWRSYGRLHLRDGFVFFIFVIFGPLFGGFFFQFSDLLLSSTRGLPLIIVAILILLIMQVWQRRRTGSSIIPAHIWAAIFAAIAILYQASISTRLYPLVVLSSIMATIVTTLAWDFNGLTFPKALFGFLVPTSFIIGIWFNLWLGVFIGIISIGIGLNYNKYFWIPWSFWLVMTISILGSFLISRKVVLENTASAGILLLTVLVIWLKKRKFQREIY